MNKIKVKFTNDQVAFIKELAKEFKVNDGLILESMISRGLSRKMELQDYIKKIMEEKTMRKTKEVKVKVSEYIQQRFEKTMNKVLAARSFLTDSENEMTKLWKDVSEELRIDKEKTIEGLMYDRKKGIIRYTVYTETLKQAIKRNAKK